MSKQAFEKMMSQLPGEDRKNIYAVAAAYGLDFEAPEWIPFAVSQHGLLSIQRAIVDLRTALAEGSDFAIAQAMKALAAAKDAELVKLQAATAASQATVKDAAEKARHAINVHAATLQAELLRGMASSVRHLLDESFNAHSEKINAAQLSLAQSLSLAEARLGQIRHVGTIQVLGWAALGGIIGGVIVTLTMWWVISQGYVQQPQTKITLDGKAVGQYIVNSMRRK